MRIEYRHEVRASSDAISCALCARYVVPPDGQRPSLTSLTMPLLRRVQQEKHCAQGKRRELRHQRVLLIVSACARLSVWKQAVELLRVRAFHLKREFSAANVIARSYRVRRRGTSPVGVLWAGSALAVL